MLKIILKFIKVLNSENDPHQLSLAFCFAMVAGFTPIFSLHNIIVLLLVLILRVNLSGFILGLIVFSGIAYLLDPVFHGLGLFILKAGPLEGLWTTLYGSTVWRLENYNNSITMGSLVVSIILFFPAYIIFNKLIINYRDKVKAFIEKLKIVQALKASKIYSIYQTLSS
jgi:uncharacterized protein (TIGR03546 family)